MNNKEAYYALYKQIKDFDKYIARRYDNQKGSTYLPIIIDLLMDEVIYESDLADFTIEIQDYIKKVKNNLQ